MPASGSDLYISTFKHPENCEVRMKIAFTIENNAWIKRKFADIHRRQGATIVRGFEIGANSSNIL